jgi:hypothetical protein
VIIIKDWENRPWDEAGPKGGGVDTHITDESVAVCCQMLKDAMRVNPEARPVAISIIDTLMDNHGPQARWGTIFFRLWQQMNDEPRSGKEAP